MKRALVLVDLQNDFMPSGRLPVPKGDEVLPIAQELIRGFELVVATQDWHPPDHLSFAAQHPGKKPGETVEIEGLPRVLWPEHCVQGSPGAELAGGLDFGPVKAIFRKGTDRNVDSYSAFFGNGRRQTTGLQFFLSGLGATEVYVLGLALDYCVKATALDARALGFETRVFRAACRAVNACAGDDERALEEMSAAGIEIR
jgi:nicotinamidase/pyrazinamidase